MSGEELILHFYGFNGRSVTIDQLKKFLSKVQTYIDSIGTGTFVPQLREIQSRVITTIKDWKSEGILEVERMEVEPPLKINIHATLEPKPKKKLGSVKKKKRKNFKPKS